MLSWIIFEVLHFLFYVNSSSFSNESGVARIHWFWSFFSTARNEQRNHSPQYTRPRYMHIWIWIYNQRVSYFMSGSNWPFSASLRFVHLKAEVLEESTAISLFCTFSACLVIESVCPWSLITDLLDRLLSNCQIVTVSEKWRHNCSKKKHHTTLFRTFLNNQATLICKASPIWCII